MTYRVPDRVAYVTNDGQLDSTPAPLRVSLMCLPDGVPVVLTGSAALIWLVAAEGSPNVVDDVAEGAGQSAGVIHSDVEAFLAELVGLGLLERVDGLDDVTLGGTA